MSPILRIYGSQAELLAHNMEGRGWKSPLLPNQEEFPVLSTISEGTGQVGRIRMGSRSSVIPPVPSLHLWPTSLQTPKYLHLP